MTTRYYPPDDSSSNTDPIAAQAQTTYENYKKIKGFEDVGYFLLAYVVSGGAVTQNITRNDTIDITDIVVSLNDDIMAREGTSFRSKIANTNYYLDFTSDGDWYWGTSHPDGLIGTDYLTIATVTTNGSMNIASITDTRGPVGGFRLKSDYGLEDYALKADVDAQLADIAKLIVSPLRFGAVGDEITDDTQSIQNAIEHAELTGAILDGLGKTYLVSDVMGLIPADAGSYRDDYGLYISGSITMRNINFKLKDACADFTTVINIYSGSDEYVTLENVTIDGNRDNQTHTEAREDGGMHGVRLYGNTTSSVTGIIHINKCKINNCESDGMVFRTITPQRATVENCLFDNNTRNGFTDNTLDNMTVRNCEFSNTNGSAPESGYHCEPDDNKTFKNRIIEGCKSINNTYGFRFDIRPGNCDNIVFRDCYTDKDITFVTESTDANIRTFKNILIDNCIALEINISHNGSTAGLGTGEVNNVKVSKCRVTTNVKFDGGDSGKITDVFVDKLKGRIQLLGNLDGVTIKEIKAISDTSAGRGIYGIFATSIKNLIIESCHFEVAEGITCKLIDLSVGTNENIKIKNCTFKSNDYSIYVVGDKVLIDGNTFYARGSFSYFTRALTATNVIYINNIQVNKQIDGTAPSGAVNSLDTTAVQSNNIIM